MSVAFRRESDDEHLEPKFELPIPSGPNIVTPRGLDLIRARVTDLESAAAAVPDPEARKPIERDLRYWRTRLATAELAPAPEDGIVGIGTRVTFRLNGATRMLAITGHDEADPDAGTIAFSGSAGSPSCCRSARTAPATAVRPTSLSVPPTRRAARSSSRPAW